MEELVRRIAIGFTVGLSTFILVALVLLTIGPQLGRWAADLMGLGRLFEVTWNIVRRPAIVGLIVVAIALLYYFAPMSSKPRPGRLCWVSPSLAEYRLT